MSLFHKQLRRLSRAMEFANIDRLDELQGLLAGRSTAPAEESGSVAGAMVAAPTPRSDRASSGEGA